MSTPVMLAGLLTTSYGFVDMIFASRLGGVQVASVAFVAPLFVMLTTIVAAISKSGVSVIAKLIGQKDHDQAAAYATQLRIIVIGIALFFSIAGVLLASPLLRVLQIDGELFEQSLIYTRIMFFSMPATAVVSLYITLFSSQGKMNISTQTSLMALVSNVILNSLSIFVLRLGIDGLAYASLITKFVLAVFIVWLYHRNQHDFEISWRVNPVYNARNIVIHLLRVAAPLSFAQGSSQFGFLLMNVLIAPLGYEVVAAFAIGNRINSLMFMTTKQIGPGIVPLIAHNWGAKAMGRVRQAITQGLFYSLLWGVLGAIFLHFVKHPLSAFLTQGEANIQPYVLSYVGLVGWTVIAWAVFHMLQSIFESFQKTSFTFWISAFRLWGVRIPGVLLFSTFMPQLEELGIWYTVFASNIVTLLFALIFFATQIQGVLTSDAGSGLAHDTEVLAPLADGAKL